MTTLFQEDLSQKKEDIDATRDEINKLKGLQKEYLQDKTNEEVKMKETKDGKALVDEGTSSTASQDDSKKEVDQSEKPKKNVATPKKNTKAIKNKGPQETKTPPPKKNEKYSRYVRLFNGYCFLCAKYGHMARDYEFFDRNDHYLQNPRSKFAGSRDRFHDDFFKREYMLDEPNIEFFKFHNYGHNDRGCRYKMESPMENIECFKCHNYGNMARDCRNKNVWKRKQVQEDRVDNKVSTVMLSGFVKEKGLKEIAVVSNNDSSQDVPLGDSLF